MSYFEPSLQPVIITNITPGVRAIIEPPRDPEVIKFLKINTMYLLPRKVVLDFQEWHLFLNGFFNEPYGSPSGKPFQLFRNFDVDDFLKSKGLANLATLQKMMIKSSIEFRNSKGDS